MHLVVVLKLAPLDLLYQLFEPEYSMLDFLFAPNNHDSNIWLIRDRYCDHRNQTLLMLDSSHAMMAQLVIHYSQHLDYWSSEMANDMKTTKMTTTEWRNTKMNVIFK